MREPTYRDTREKLLSEGLNYLADNGIENVSLRDLSKITGVSIGSVYYWFQNKDKLIIDVAEYGLKKSAEYIFDYVFERIEDIRDFFDTCVSEISKYRMQLRLVYQLAASPQYGAQIRKTADELIAVYDRLAVKLSGLMSCPLSKTKPIVYMLVSVLLDYIIWESLEKTRPQLDYIYDEMIALWHSNGKN